MKKNLVEEFNKVVEDHKGELETLNKEVQKKIKEMVKLSNKLGIPFFLDVWDDFPKRPYFPKKFIKVQNYLEEKTHNTPWSEDASKEVKEAYHKAFDEMSDFNEIWQSYDAPDDGGWKYWDSSSVSC